MTDAYVSTGDSIDCDREVLEITSGGRAGGGGASEDLSDFLDFEDCSNEPVGAQPGTTVDQESTAEPRRPPEPEIERAAQVDTAGAATAAAAAPDDKQIKQLPDFIDRLQTCVSHIVDAQKGARISLRSS